MRRVMRQMSAAQVRERFIALDDVSVHAVTWDGRRRNRGESDHVLLLHGLGGSTIQWSLVGRELAVRAGTSVTAIDLAGFGLTRALRRPATVEKNAELVTAFLREEGPAHVAGISMGGAIGIRVAAHTGQLVKRLTLVGSAFPLNAGTPLAARNLPAALPVLGPFFTSLYSTVLKPTEIVDDRLSASMRRPPQVRPEVYGQLVALAGVRKEFTEGPRAYADAARSLFAYAAMPWGEIADVLRVRCPTQIIHGAQDRLVPLQLATIIRRLRPDWRLDVIDECGHLPTFESPDQLLDLMVASSTSETTPAAA